MYVTVLKLYDYLQCPHQVWRDEYGLQEEKIEETSISKISLFVSQERYITALKLQKKKKNYHFLFATNYMKKENNKKLNSKNEKSIH